MRFDRTVVRYFELQTYGKAIRKLSISKMPKIAQLYPFIPCYLVKKCRNCIL
jgi:hypothetical protein